MPRNETNERVAEIMRALRAFQRAADALDDAVTSRLGLNRTDLRCLDLLSEGAVSAGELATATGLSLSATTTMLDRLEKRDLLRRVVDPADRRRVRVEATETGAAAAGRFHRPLTQDAANLLSGYAPDHLDAIRAFFVAFTALSERHRRRALGTAGQG
jgi:DNA-binding MarR family transcriptional regulator